MTEMCSSSSSSVSLPARNPVCNLNIFKPWISLDDSAIDQKSGNTQHNPHDALEKMIKHKCCPHVDLGWSWMILLPTSANDETEEFEGNGVPCYREFWKKKGKSSEICWNPTHLATSNSTLSALGAFGQPTLLRNLRRWGLGVDFGVAELGSSALSKSGSKQGSGIGKRRSKATILIVDENHHHWPRDLERMYWTVWCIIHSKHIIPILILFN